MHASPRNCIGFRSILLYLLAVVFTTAIPCRAIVNGQNAAALGGQVQMFVDQSYKCTGSLISPEWVLTAKHCLTINNATAFNTDIRIGDLRLGQGEVHTVTELLGNPDDDVALLRLSQATNQVNLVAPWGLVDPDYFSTAFVGAWGQTDLATGQLPSVLQTATYSVGPFGSSAPLPLPGYGPIADYVSLTNFGSQLLFGDSGAGAFSNGLVCAVVAGGVPGNFSGFAVKTQAVAIWILSTTRVIPAGICSKLTLPKRLRLMALGDQITQGTTSILNAANSYRSTLNTTLTATKLDISLTGSQHNGDDPAASSWEGGSEFNISLIEEDAKCAVFNYAPDVVTLEAGIQDLANGSLGGGAEVRMESLIDTILTVSPKTTVLVASIPPHPSPAIEPQIESFNAILKNKVVGRQSAGQHVDFVDIGAVTVDDTFLDKKLDIYLNANGYLKMAHAFSFSVEKAVSNGWIADQLSLHSDLCKSAGGLSGSGGSGITKRSLPTQTYTVNAGGMSFTTEQPSDSVATYTWTDGGTATEWLTSADGSGLYNQLASGPVSGSSTANASSTITVDAGKTYQQIDGFGGAMTDSAASLIAGSPQRDAIMGMLFGQSDGEAGLTMVRSPMGSSDLMASPNDIHTYQDSPNDIVSVTPYPSDQRQIDVLTQAKSIVGSGDFKLLGTPWTAPGWMKRGGSLLPAQCGTDQNELDLTHLTDYAWYFKRYAYLYDSVGLRPWMVSMGNEPENCKTGMPTTLLSASDEVALSQAIKRQLPFGIKVLGWDHNWNDETYVKTLTDSGNVDAIGYHCYDGTHYGNQTQAVATYMTECSGFTDQSSDVAGNMGFEVANLLIGPMRNGSHGSLYWSLAQDPTGNPHLASSDACQNCRGMITVNGDGSFQPSQDFYFWAQFSKFIRPGSLRVDSTNWGDLSTVAFRNGNQNTLVVLNSHTHADGGSAGSDERDLRGHILQYSGDTMAQKTAWLVGADGYRRYIGSSSDYNCLKYDAGMQGPDVEPGGALDKYINLKDVWAVCGAGTMGTRSELEIGTYLKSPGGARLTLTKKGLTSVDSSGNSHWAPSGQLVSSGDRFILQEDGNLVLFSGTYVVWASGTNGSGAIWLSIRDDGTFALFDKNNKEVWTSASFTNLLDYYGKIVEWDGDSSAQKTSWQVGNDGNRRVIHDQATFQCLHDAGAGNSLPTSADILSQLPDLTGVWATCGADRIGPNGALELGSHLQSGDYTLTLTSDGLNETKNGLLVASENGGAELKLQPDGNLVTYTKNGSVAWTTGTNGSSPGWFVLGSDGSLILYDGTGKSVWHHIL